MMHGRVLTAIGILLLSGTAAYAILGIADTAIVNDPLNLVQNAWSAIRGLQSNINEAAQLRQTIEGYVQDAKAFVSLPMSVMDEVSGLYTQYTDLLTQGRGMSWQITNTVNQFEQLYATGFNGNMSMMQRATAMLGQIRAAGLAASQTTAIFDRLCNQQTQVTRLIAASQQAPGSLAAQQASNQLMGVLADQQASLQQIAATTGRVQTGFIMREVVAEERAQWNAQEFMRDTSGETVRPIGQGHGFTLPR